MLSILNSRADPLLVAQFTFQAAIAKDYPIVQAGVMIASTLLVVSYLLRDITYAIVDPRIKVS